MSLPRVAAPRVPALCGLAHRVNTHCRHAGRMHAVLAVLARTLLCAALITGLAAPAQAACALRIPAVFDLAPAGYVPGSSEVLEATVNLSVDGGSSGCVWAVGAQDGGAGARVLNGPGGSIPYDLHPGTAGNARLRDLPLAAAGELLVGSVAAGQSVNANVRVRFPGKAILAPGAYTGTQRLHLYEADATAPGGYREREARDLRLMLNLAPFVNAWVDIDGSSSAFGVPRVIDFGELVSDARRSLRLVIDSNVQIGMNVLAEDVNKLLSRSAYGLASVPYRLDLTRYDRLATGYIFQYEISIGPLGAATPGAYTSGITFTVTAR